MKKKAEIQPQLHWQEEQETLTLTGEPVVELSLCLPQLESGGRGGARINQYYEQVKKKVCTRWRRDLYFMACLDLVEKRDASRPFHPWQVALKGEGALLEGGLLSVRIECQEIRADRRALKSCDCTLWRIREGAPVSFKEWTKKSVPRRVLTAATREGLTALQKGGVFLHGDWETTFSRWMLLRRFYLTDEGLALFFPQCTIAPSVEGIITVPVSNLLPEKTERKSEEKLA